VTDGTTLFAQLMLCTQQCGVSWRIVWNKRHDYREAFKQWDMDKVAAMGESDLDELCDKEGAWAGRLLQNRNKLAAIIHNAKQCVKIEKSTPGGLSAFLWHAVASDCAKASAEAGDTTFTVGLDGLSEPLKLDSAAVNATKDKDDASYQAVFGTTSAFSDKLASTLKGKGSLPEGSVPFEPFRYLGSITLQAFLLQNGLLNGHAPTCAKNPRSGKPQPSSPLTMHACDGDGDGHGDRLARTALASRKRRAFPAHGSAQSSPAAARPRRAPAPADSADGVFL
jgi:3-methyladenine DNA glycosylase Tag